MEFVSGAAEYFTFVEQAEMRTRADFVDTALKILPLLYIKGAMLPPCEMMGDEAPESFVAEDDYEVIRVTLAQLMGDADDYLDVFVEDMVYSDTPIKKNISEDLADIYQDIKNFVCVFRLGLNETMHDSLAICRENFANYWGQTVGITMRALHDVRYHQR